MMALIAYGKMRRVSSGTRSEALSSIVSSRGGLWLGGNVSNRVRPWHAFSVSRAQASVGSGPLKSTLGPNLPSRRGLLCVPASGSLRLFARHSLQCRSHDCGRYYQRGSYLMPPSVRGRCAVRIAVWSKRTYSAGGLLTQVFGQRSVDFSSSSSSHQCIDSALEILVVSSLENRLFRK